ncbi:MAG TPA: MarR family transcriptional regulator [Caulobacteraceae bacterium]|nr:MarR family transcriptional regulator [Caulobacteraceae bacterium]
MTAPKAQRPASTTDPEGEFPYDVITYVFHLFAVLARHREAVLEEAFRPLGLNVARYRALSVIARLEPLGMSELADFSAVDRTTMTRTVDQLVAGGLVSRETPPTDRRQVLLRVTPDGRTANQQALRAVYRVNRRALDGIEEEDQRRFARLQQAMLSNLVADAALVRRLVLHTRDGAD